MSKTKAELAEEIPWATDEEAQVILDLAESLVKDGDLSADDVALISAAIEEQESRGRLTKKQRAAIQDIAKEGVKEFGVSKVTKPMKAFAVLSFVTGILTLASLALLIYAMLIYGSGVLDEYQGSTTELAITAIQTAILAAGSVLHVVLGVRLLRNKRYGASQIATILVGLGVADMFFESMLTGISSSLVYATIVVVIRIALSVYLNPSLNQERKLAGNIRKSDTRVRAESETLGLDLEGKGYIKLDFFNLFWVFVVACFLGLVVEVIFHMVVVDPGVYQDRRGLLFGPFSPIYGVGAVLMTIALNRFKEARLPLIFVVCTIIGGAFEFTVSWWMEVAFGVVAWDYSDQFLNICGRTCLLYASMFGLLGLWWIKWALPRLLALINKIPWKVRYSVTAVCAVLMLFNVGMTLESLDCWQERVNGEPVVSEVQQFYAEHFDNDVMQSRFQSMVITPQNK